jgi:streptogramin lyase
MIAVALTLASQAAHFKLDPIAGTGQPGFSGDNGPATQAQLNNTYGLTIGPNGDLYICDMANHRIRKIDSKGIITTVAGNGQKGWSGDSGPALQASLNEPYEIRFDRNDNMYFVEMRNHLVRRVDAKTGLISTVAGQGRPGFAGDNGPATAALLNQPHSIQFVGQDLWICDIGNHRIRKIDLKTALISTVGGTGEKAATRDNEILKGNPLNGPRAIDVYGNNLWLALREGNAICKVDLTTQRIRTVINSGLAGPKGITIAPNGWVIWADTESHAIRYLDPKDNTVHLLAAHLKRPHGVYAHTDGTLYIADSENHRILRVKLP